MCESCQIYGRLSFPILTLNIYNYMTNIINYNMNWGSYANLNLNLYGHDSLLNLHSLYRIN